MSELKEVSDEIIGLQGNKIFRTVKDLTIKPGQVISEYCKGEKQKYLSPVVYFFGIAGILYYLSSITGFAAAVSRYTTENFKRTLFSLGFDFQSENVSNTIYSVLSNETFGTVVFLPVTLLFTWLIFKKHNRSFKENSWFALYCGGHSVLIRLPLFLIWYFVKDDKLIPILGPSFLVISWLYAVWVAKEYYRIKLGRAFLLISLLKILIGVLFSVTIHLALILILNYG